MVASAVYWHTDAKGVQVKEFVSYDDRNFFLPAVTYTNAETCVTETLDVIFKVALLNPHCGCIWI